MEQLIKITEREGNQVVSAKDLHTFLGNKKQFSDWIKHRISKYGLIESQDYEAVSLTGETGGRYTEYALTLDAAKELAMVEGNAKGKQARLYFIACEKKLKEVSAPKSQAEILLMYAQMNVENERRIAANEKKLIELEQTIEEKIANQEEVFSRQINTPLNYYAVAGFASLLGRQINTTIAATIGRKAKAICNSIGYETFDIPDPRFGKVKTYPRDVLKQVFNEYFKTNFPTPKYY